MHSAGCILLSSLFLLLYKGSTTKINLSVLTRDCPNVILSGSSFPSPGEKNPNRKEEQKQVGFVCLLNNDELSYTCLKAVGKRRGKYWKILKRQWDIMKQHRFENRFKSIGCHFTAVWSWASYQISLISGFLKCEMEVTAISEGYCCCCQIACRVRLCATPWTAAYQASPSMGFSRQEYWSGVPLPSPEESLGLQGNPSSPS